MANASLEVESVIKKWANKYADEDGTINADEAQKLLRGAENHHRLALSLKVHILWFQSVQGKWQESL